MVQIPEMNWLPMCQALTAIAFARCMDYEELVQWSSADELGIPKDELLDRMESAVKALNDAAGQERVTVSGRCKVCMTAGKQAIPAALFRDFPVMWDWAVSEQKSDGNYSFTGELSRKGFPTTASDGDGVGHWTKVELDVATFGPWLLTYWSNKIRNEVANHQMPYGEARALLLSLGLGRFIDHGSGKKIEDFLPPKPKLEFDHACRIYQKYVETYPPDEHPPSLPDDISYLNEFGFIGRDPVRKIRADFAPSHWSEGFTPKKYRAKPSVSQKLEKK